MSEKEVLEVADKAKMMVVPVLQFGYMTYRGVKRDGSP